MLTELGARLREARESKGYTLEDIQQMTKIQKRYLMGIEEGNYDMMPGKFYARAFIKQYAEAIGLQPEELFDTYKNDIPATNSEDLPEKLSRVQTRSNVPQSTSKVFDFIPKLLVALFVIGALLVAWYFLRDQLSDDGSNVQGNNETQVEEKVNDTVEDTTDLMGNDTNAADDGTSGEKEDAKENDKESSEKTEEPVEEEKKQTITAAGTSGIKTTYQVQNAEAFKVELVTTGDSWMEVYNSKNDALFIGMMTDGQTEEIDLGQDSQAYIIIGDSTKTVIKVNGEELKYEIPPANEVRQDFIINYSSEQ